MLTNWLTTPSLGNYVDLIGILFAVNFVGQTKRLHYLSDNKPNFCLCFKIKHDGLKNPVSKAVLGIFSITSLTEWHIRKWVGRLHDRSIAKTFWSLKKERNWTVMLGLVDIDDGWLETRFLICQALNLT